MARARPRRPRAVPGVAQCLCGVTADGQARRFESASVSRVSTSGQTTTSSLSSLELSAVVRSGRAP
eukprot:3134453-Lingulodinium_polyedra.AAC.1